MMPHRSALHRAAQDGPTIGSQRNVVLYIGRVQGRYRAVSNEADLLTAIKARLKQEYTLVALVDPWDMADTATTAARAVALIGPHGGALLVRAPVVCHRVYVCVCMYVCACACACACACVG
jgi:hypothetical protein